MNLQAEIEKLIDERVSQKLAEVVPPVPAIHDAEAEDIARKLQRINAKQYITINEFQFLFGCSRGYVDKLLDEAANNKTTHPVPYCDLNGLCVFDRVKVIKWAEGSKRMKPGQKKSGGNKTHLKQVVNQ
jgi:hypothetical protein